METTKIGRDREYGIQERQQEEGLLSIKKRALRRHIIALCNFLHSERCTATD